MAAEAATVALLANAPELAAHEPADEVQVAGRVTDHPQILTDLAAVVGAVVDDVQDDLPERHGAGSGARPGVLDIASLFKSLVRMGVLNFPYHWVYHTLSSPNLHNFSIKIAHIASIILPSCSEEN